MLRSYGATLPYLIIVAVEKGGVVVVMGSGGSGFLVGCSSLFFFFSCTPYASKHLGEAMGTKNGGLSHSPSSHLRRPLPTYLTLPYFILIIFFKDHSRQIKTI